MKAITFKITCINLPGWPKDLHHTHNQGYAYALPTHYVYLCGENSPYASWSYLSRLPELDQRILIVIPSSY